MKMNLLGHFSLSCVDVNQHGQTALQQGCIIYSGLCENKNVECLNESIKFWTEHTKALPLLRPGADRSGQIDRQLILPVPLSSAVRHGGFLLPSLENLDETRVVCFASNGVTDNPASGKTALSNTRARTHGRTHAGRQAGTHIVSLLYLKYLKAKIKVHYSMYILDIHYILIFMPVSDMTNANLKSNWAWHHFSFDVGVDGEHHERIKPACVIF